MFLAKLESLIFLCLFIVFIPRMIVSKIIQLHKAGYDPIRYSLCTIFCKKIMSGIFFFIFLAVSHSIYACLKVAGICIGIVRCLPVCCAEKSQLADLDPVEVIDHMLLQIRQCIGSLSVVGIDRIKFVGIKEIIVTAAANGTDSFQLIVIFENAHKTGNITFHRRFVDNTGMSDTTLGSSDTVVAHHHGNRSSPSNALRNIFAGKIALYLGFFLLFLIRDKAYQILPCSKSGNSLGNADACSCDTCQDTCLFHSHILPPFLKAEEFSA